jgi:glycosyltransferase involved in cell wall biosynthesis
MGVGESRKADRVINLEVQHKSNEASAYRRSRRLRILHVVPTYFPAVRYGGPIFAVHGLCRALAAMGHHVEVFTTNVDGPGNSDVPLHAPVLFDGVLVRYFSSRNLRRLFWSPPLKRALDRDISGFDAVHLHSVFLWPTWAAARAARKAGVPYLISPRGMLVKELIERRSRYVKAAWIQLIEKRNLECAAAVHVTSEVEAQELDAFGWRLRKIATIPNGIEDIISSIGHQISADVADITSRQPLCLFFGRLSWKKGLDRLLRAFALTTTGTLAIVGPDDEVMVPALTQLAHDLNIAARVRFLPRVVLGADKEHLYARAQLFVLTSVSENFANTVLEAMQRGVPVVTTPEVGAAKVVTEANGGLVVAGGPEALADAIQSLTDSPGLARIMGSAGRQHVQERYRWPSIAIQMEELYASLALVKDARDSMTADNPVTAINLSKASDGSSLSA